MVSYPVPVHFLTRHIPIPPPNFRPRSTCIRFQTLVPKFVAFRYHEVTQFSMGLEISELNSTELLYLPTDARRHP